METGRLPPHWSVAHAEVSLSVIVKDYGRGSAALTVFESG
jgi:hypothetical protein